MCYQVFSMSELHKVVNEVIRANAVMKTNTA